MAGKKGMKRYDAATKLRAVAMCLEEGATHRQAAAVLGLPRPELVEQWVRRYRQEGAAGFGRPVGRPRQNPATGAAYVAQLEMENELLKKFHTELRKVGPARRDIGSSSTTEDASR